MSESPFKHIRRNIQVCTQMRYAPNPKCCGNGGGSDLLSVLAEQIKSNSLDVDIEQSNCLLMCIKGPNVMLTPDGKVWSHASLDSIPEIINYLQNNA